MNITRSFPSLPPTGLVPIKKTYLRKAKPIVPPTEAQSAHPFIAQVFYDLEIIERYGSGIHRMLDACTTAGFPSS